MRDLATIYASLVVSAAIMVVMCRRSHGKSVLFYLASFFALFAFGPVINYALGQPIYSGTRTEAIGRASIGFTLALLGLALADQLIRQRVDYPAVPLADPSRLYQLYPLVLGGLTVYGLLATARLIQVGGANKLDRVAAAGQGHSIFLLAELCVVSTYFLTRRSRLLRKLWAVNAVTYVTYCLATSERDFLFVLFSILLHRQLVSRRRGPSKRVLLGGAGAVLLASILFASRAGVTLSVEGILNQGSLLFVDTFVMTLIPQATDFAFGQTYWDSLMSLPPAWLHDGGTIPLSSWLVNIYAPGNPGGYGFSLSAEAYMNFGLLGIFVTFFLLGLLLRHMVNRFAVTEWATFFSVYVTAVTMYAFRGDSSQFAKSVVYGSIFFVAIHLTSVRRAPVDRTTGVPTPRATQISPSTSVGAARPCGMQPVPPRRAVGGSAAS